MPTCIFSHELIPTLPKAITPTKLQNTGDTSVVEQGNFKRRKLASGGKETSLEGYVNSEKPGQTAFVGVLAPKPHTASPNSDKKNNGKIQTEVSAKNPQTIQSAQRPISPPPLSSAVKKTSAQAPKKEIKESLNPRMVPKDPAGYVTRRMLLVKMHEEMVKLNDQVSKSSDTETKSLHLVENDLIKFALTEEEKIALDQPSVYANIVKMRIMAYRKMKVDDWIKERKEALEAKKGDVPAAPEAPEPIDTGLTPEQEVMMLSRLIATQTGLDAHGYVTKPPTEDEIETARKGVEAAANWEVCDRCATRFQVFPDRREDGALTTGGKCTHHWGRRVFPKHEKSDAITGPKQTRYSCCNEVIGSPGCTVSETHVFKISEAKRLAAVLPFIETPANPVAPANTAVCFDCEMGYTCHGLELIRLTATTWPSGAALIDVLVRPLGAILDLNSRFSGVFPEQFFSAPEYNPNINPKNPFAFPSPRSKTPTPAPQHDPSSLPILPSPASARALLLTHLTTATPLLGHALENDLNAVRLVHPSIVDTALLFPHPRGLPLRLGLRNLARLHLGREIQTGGAAGHDSLEDARATGELVRCRVKAEWRRLWGAGWGVGIGGFVPPVGVEGEKVEEVDKVAEEGYQKLSREKRKWGSAQLDGADEEDGKGGAKRSGGGDGDDSVFLAY